MSVRLRGLWLAVTLALIALGAPVSARADGILPVTAPGSVQIAGDWRNGILTADQGAYWVGHDTVNWTQSDNAVSIGATRPGARYSVAMTFQAPAGQSLQVGHYVVKREYDAPPPPVIQVSGGSTCSKQYGEFDVLDLAPDRLWLTFRATCAKDSLGPSVYGEVRFGEPLTGDVLTVPTRMPWGPEPLGETNDPVPVTLVNLGDSPLAVSGVHAAGPNAADFLVGSASGCASVPAGGSCSVGVTFEPTGLGARTATLAVADSRGGRTIALSGSGASAPDWSDIPIPSNGHYGTCGVGMAVGGPDSITFQWGSECQGGSDPLGSQTHFLIRGTEGTTPPTVEEDGFTVYSGHGHSATVGGFNPAKVYSFTLFTQYRDGGETTTSMTVYPTVVSATMELSTTTKGSPLLAAGYATVPGGRALTSLPIELRALYPGTTTPVVVATGETDYRGYYEIRYVPNRAAAYFVTFTKPGYGEFPGSSLSRFFPLIVATAMRVPSRTIAYGKPTTITGSVAPFEPALVAFQVLVNHKWKTLATAIPNAKGVLSFRVTFKNKGTFSYRVWWAGTDDSWASASRTAQIKVK